MALASGFGMLLRRTAPLSTLTTLIAALASTLASATVPTLTTFVLVFVSTTATGGLAPFTTDLCHMLRAVLLDDCFAALLSGFTNGHFTIALTALITTLASALATATSIL